MFLVALKIKFSNLLKYSSLLADAVSLDAIIVIHKENSLEIWS